MTDQMIRPQTSAPTIRATMHDQVHSLRMSWAWSVTPAGQPKRQPVLLGVLHPARVRTPRRPSAATRARLLPRATARCLLVLRPARRTVLTADACRASGGRLHADHNVGRD